MRKADFWKTDWFLGVVVSAVLFVFAQGELIQSLERKAYDIGVQLSDRQASDRIGVIAIDDVSIANLGRWPWSRELHARMTDLLAGAQAKVVVNTVLFSEPQRDPGYDYVLRLIDLYLRAAAPADPDAPPLPPEVQAMGGVLQEAEQALNPDRRLAAAYRASGSVLLPILFELGEPLGRPDQVLSDAVQKSRLANVAGEGFAWPAQQVQPPIAPLAEVAGGIGHLNTITDVDGGTRAEALVVRYFDQYYPALSLLAAARSLNLEPRDISVKLGEEVRVGRLRIPTDDATQMLTHFYADRDGRPAFAVDSFYDVLSGKIPAAKYRDKVVLIGATAAGVGSTQVTPVAPAMAPVLTLAHTVSSILREHFFVSPSWAPWVTHGSALLIALYLIVLLPRMSAGLAAAATGGLLVLLLAAHATLMVGAGLWIPLMSTAMLLTVGHLLLTTKRFLVTERGKEQSEAVSAESNRMLALAFQGQGQIDMAWDKMRQVPVNDALLDNLYNLALDFERKRQFNKAEAVFAHMAAFKPDFKDLPQRIARAKQLSETVILGGGAHPGGSMVIGGGTEKPMLGRYQVEKELGKGAMGVVYLGRDPKINRVVAIKTMALSQEFEADELDEVKARFFREAETAGRLNHPNIVTIFDAGDEHDLAYIAMEFLKGHDLVPFTRPGALLPLPEVIRIVAQVADALAYAHQNHVVHRDVKPANIMYEPDTQQVKVTDFGIARITDSSKTKTGMVLGTPSFMSPEQLAGKKIDGRSDLFSLGGTLYQLACGRLPFVAESMAQLMFKIANEPHADIRTINPAVPECLATIIDRALAKNIEARYQSGTEMANDLRACLQAQSAG